MDYADLLNRYMKKSGKTLEQIAYECENLGVKIHPTYISKLRLGKRRPPSDDVTKVLSKVLNIDEDELLLAAQIEKMPSGIKELYLSIPSGYPGAEIIWETIENMKKDGFLNEEMLDRITYILKREGYEIKSENITKDIILSLDFNTGSELSRLINEFHLNFSQDFKHHLNNTMSVGIDDVVLVPILGHIPAGQPILADEHIKDWEPVYNQGKYKEGDLFILSVKGDSMIGSRIYDGDKVLVKVQPNVENGEIAVVNVNGYDATLKRVKKTEDGKVILYPDNPKYDPIFINDENSRICGKVIQVMFDPNKK